MIRACSGFQPSFCRAAGNLSTDSRIGVIYAHPPIDVLMARLCPRSAEDAMRRTGLRKGSSMQSHGEEAQILPENAAAAARETESAAIQGYRSKIHCPECGTSNITRIARSGLLRRFIYPLFGFYPWRCVRCGATSMLKWRDQPRKRRRHAKSSSMPEVNPTSRQSPSMR